MIGLPFYSSDRNLASRMEAAEAENMAALAHAAVSKMLGAAFERVAGGTAVFAGVGSPMTHAMGIGLGGHVPQAELERMEAFFEDRGSACLVDLCPLADPSVIAFVQSRPYRIIEFNNVLARRILADEQFAPVPEVVRPIRPEELPAWTKAVTEGFSEGAPATEETLFTMSSSMGDSLCWIVDSGEPAGGAAMGIRDRTALFYGDALIPQARRAGYQTALIRARLQEAQRQGCDLAMVSVLPGSGSHRNYERAGFQLIYMRVNLMREFSARDVPHEVR